MIVYPSAVYATVNKLCCRPLIGPILTRVIQTNKPENRIKRLPKTPLQNYFLPVPIGLFSGLPN